MNKRNQPQRWVSKFTDPTIMKFQPVQDYEEPSQNPAEGLFTRIRNFFSPPARPPSPKSPIKRLKSNKSKTDEDAASVKPVGKEKPKIKFVKRLTNEHVIVGNEDQLDAMNISGIVGEFVDTEFLWSLRLKKAIIQVSVDYKRNYIVLLAKEEVFVYSFDIKFMHQQPVLIGSVSLSKPVWHLTVLRQSIFALFYHNCIEMYLVDDVKGIRATLRKNYNLPLPQLRLFQIPEPFENTLNIFFEEPKENESTFSLWNINVQFNQKEVKLSKASKIYEIPKYLRSFTRLQNYSRTIYLINLGKNILAVRKGYIIDTASVNIQAGHNYLRYLSHNKLLHVTDHKVQIYNFSINQQVHPPRIIVDSLDSISIPSLPSHHEYIQALQIISDNFAVFYQLDPVHNKLVRGETKYSFIMSHLIKMEDKLRHILPHDVAKEEFVHIEERADMANKMGLERKEIYLRLWNNSNKNQVEDYNLLLDTLHYDTIKAEIEKKLKKNSMSFRQVQLIEQGCLSMLQGNVFKPQNTKQDIKNYFISSTFFQKLQLYKRITLEDKKQGKNISQDPNGRLLINFQNYNYYKGVDIKSMLFQLINSYCNDGKNQIYKIRLLIKQFKFPLRIVYKEILSEIIQHTRKRFLKLLKAMPEILPFEPQKTDSAQDFTLLAGLWAPITQEQWLKNLHIDSVSTLDNRQNLAEVCSTVWYKRYWLSQHDFVNLTKAEIKKIHKINSSYQTFYLAIEKLFDFIKEYEPIRQIIDFIQDQYEAMPQHLYGKIFLYRKLFDHFKQNKHINKFDQLQAFSLFLRLKDEDLFRHMFNFEKVKKGFILRQIRPLYEKLSCIQVFNEGMLNYFSSEISQISDIKCILNRLNNEKRQFHQQNPGIYQVLVRGMQLKLKMGSQSDIPIDEVLIYIENIPFSHQTSIKKDLQLIQRINQYSQRFKQVKLNMTIFEMTKNIDTVIAALIVQEIKKARLHQARDIQVIRSQTYRIIEDIEQIKERIYPDQGHHQLSFFIFMTELMQEKDVISAVAVLLEDEGLNQKFEITQNLIQNMVIYVYKRNMSSKPSFKANSAYLRQLVTLLPSDNPIRNYILAELQMAQILDSKALTVYYPLSGYNQYFTSRDLQNFIAEVPCQQLLQIDIEKLYQCSLQVQQLGSDKEVSEITLRGTYQIVIYRLVDCHMLKECFDKIRTLIEIKGESNNNFIYPALIVCKIAPEMIEENRHLLLKCATHLFGAPLKLLSLLQEIMNIKATSTQYKNLILKYYNETKADTVNFSQNCPIIEPDILAILDSPEAKKNCSTLLRYSLYNLLRQKEAFSSGAEYYIMYIMLINDPYVLVKYFFQNRFKIAFKNLRCFFSYLIKDPLFSKRNVLEFAKRLFFIAYQTVSKNLDIEDVIDEIKSRPLDEPIDVSEAVHTKNELQKKLVANIQRIKNKMKVVQQRKAKVNINREARVNTVKKRLSNPRQQLGIYDYPFQDSDDNARKDEILKRQNKLEPLKIDTFDANFERQQILNRSVKDIGLYMSIEKQKKQRQRYYTGKFVNDGIYDSLTLPNPFNVQIQEAIQISVDNAEPPTPKRLLRIGKVTSNNSKKEQELRRSRSRAIEDITTEERMVIEKEEQQVFRTPTVSIIGNFIQEGNILFKILNYETYITENTQFNFAQLEAFHLSKNFSTLLKQLVVLTYNSEKINYRGALIFIKKLNQTYPDIKINNEWIQIYLRAEGLQQKFKLDLPLRKIFVAEGLLLDSQIADNLFNFLRPHILANLNDQNFIKVCKVVNLAFKKTQLQQQILYFYLMQLLRAYNQSVQTLTISQQDEQMQKQKIKMIIHKIPTRYLFTREGDLIKIFRDEAVRKQIVTLFIDSFRNRYDLAATEFMVDKYIKKVKNPKKF